MKRQTLLEHFDAVFLLTMTSSRHVFVEVSRENGITGPQLNVLFNLQVRPEGVTMRQLSEMHLLSHGATTGLVDRMINMDLIERTRSVEDRRVVYVTLSENGKQILKQITDRRAAIIEPVLEDLEPEDKKLIQQALQILGEKLKAAF